MYQHSQFYRTLFRLTVLNRDHGPALQQLSAILNPNFNGNSKQFSTSRSMAYAEVQFQSELNLAYSVLDVDPDSDLEEVRAAYIELAKKYHPDSGTASADPRKFSQLQDAYKSILSSRKGEMMVEEDREDQYYYDIKHTAPQHRQYLSHEGIGFGTPSQRSKQYDSYRVWRAASNIQEHRIEKLAHQTESALVVKDKKEAKKAKISNAIERMVEDLIQESMNKGDFQNLPGSGKPLKYVDRNPMVDSTTHNLNKILINNGFTPEWITLQSDIRREMKEARQKLSVLQYKIENNAVINTELWSVQVERHAVTIQFTNDLIDKYNMIVPFIDKQMVHYNLQRDVQKICENCKQYLPSNPEDIEHLYRVHFEPRVSQNYYRYDDLSINWKDVWEDIKAVFRSPGAKDKV